MHALQVKCMSCTDLASGVCGTDLSDGCGGALVCNCTTGTTCNALAPGQLGTCIAQVRGDPSIKCGVLVFLP